MMLTKQNIGDLFKGWKRLFRTKMKDEDWNIETLLVWHVALNDLEMTEIEFANAMRKSLTLSWPPTAPADFLELGRADVVSSYQDVRQAYLNAANGKYEHETAYEAARLVGFGAMRGGYEYQTYPVFKEHYKNACVAHSKGANFSQPLSHQIENKTQCTHTENAITDESIAELRALIGAE